MSRHVPQPAGASLCLCLTGSTIAEDLSLLERHRHRIDMAELRADFLAPDERAAAWRLPALARGVGRAASLPASGLPMILTVRRATDGGHWTASEKERLALISRLAKRGGFAWVDLEEDLEPGLVVETGPARILRSLHDPTGLPGGLAGRLRHIARGSREVAKVAVTVRGSKDLLELVRVCQETRGVPKVLVGMGDAGLPTRVLATRLESMICYSSEGSTAAPGQTDPATLEELYRFHRISMSTKVFGVIGNPVMHSLSPIIHNRAFSELDVDAVYLPFLVDDLGAFLEAAEMLGVAGLSVTVPHKESVLPLLASRDPIVERVGACNTLVRRDGGWFGANTDVEGFLMPLRETLAGRAASGAGGLSAEPREPLSLKGLRASILGAGGASRAVAYALAASGAEVLILNRSPDRAREVALRFGARWAGLDRAGLDLMREGSDLIVQTTSAGVGSQEGEDPAPGYRFSGREIAYELIYVPRTTPFLARATEAGCTVIPGIRMLLGQATGQFRLFTDKEYPADLLAELGKTL